MPTIGLFHTSTVHVAAFRALLQDIAPTFADVHVVDEDLLTDARRRGVDDAVREKLQGRLECLVQEQADVVLCTCSTLSALAETLTAAVGVPVLRVDRPMAEAAVADGGRVAVVAALASTLAPTRELIEHSAALAGTGAVVEDRPCLDAWALFEAGDHEGYVNRIAQHVREVACTRAVDVIVLAQASMARVAGLVPDVSIPVLSSPRLAVERAAALAGACNSPTSSRRSSWLACYGPRSTGPSSVCGL